MSKIRCQRDEELNDITKEREQAFRFAEEMHEQQDYERLQTELKEAQRGNKQLMLQVHHKKLALEQMSSELEDARTQISTMHGHVQEKRDALEKRTADEFRKMDLELRHLNQTLSRLRIEWESEKSQREKSETRLQKLTTFLDVHTNALQEETQQLKMQLNEEKEARTSKDHALQIAYRDLQTLQKNCREQENAKLDAQSEVASLVQRSFVATT
ncbi:Hyaluronan mediated motility receptor [Phytophthora palmivora]|uniref:Hyaluronan mediated motility receptor n=1 Tax=Phytophthora palmivora TaxID=4796 RepID=A0A2P4X8G0_9STRA|nr:Hyaluronan mediated motility receptor [Phytophthora palmivora]